MGSSPAIGQAGKGDRYRWSSWIRPGIPTVCAGFLAAIVTTIKAIPIARAAHRGRARANARFAGARRRYVWTPV